jgi:hypothetical protein
VVMRADGDPGVRIDEHDGVVVSLLVSQSPSSLDPLGPAPRRERGRPSVRAHGAGDKPPVGAVKKCRGRPRVALGAFGAGVPVAVRGHR